MGRPNARVLPEPVCAWPTMSAPASIMGIEWSWIGVGVVMPWLASTLRLLALRLKLSNDNTCPFGEMRSHLSEGRKTELGRNQFEANVGVSRFSENSLS